MAFLWALMSVLTIVLRQTSAQSLSDIPQCAENAAISSLSSSGCKLTDIECICKDQSFVNSLIPVVKNACSPADFQKTIAFAESLCDTVGITVAVSTSTPTPSPTGTPLLLHTSSTLSYSHIYISSGLPSTIVAVSTSTSTPSPTGTPLLPHTSRTLSYSYIHISSGLPSNKSNSTKPTAATAASATPSSEPLVFQGFASTLHAHYAWAGALLGMAIFPLL